MYWMDWDTALRLGPGVAGGKGWNLGRLNRYGFPVPAGGVLSAAAYQLFLRQPGVREQVAECRCLTAADLDLPEVATRLAALRSAMTAAPLPDPVVDELRRALAGAGLSDRPVAVRSSSAAEDSAVASFAGIHQSFLQVSGLEAVLAAVKGCYASLWTPQAVAYRRRFAFDDLSVAAAVVILEMIAAKAAGVVFSCDPRTGRRDRFAVSAVSGLGDALVSGAITPDEYLVDPAAHPPAIIRRSVAGAAPALTEAQVREIALLCGRVHDALGEMDHPQDVEWAHDGERFWLLQARPVTVLPEATFPALAGRPPVWSNANLKDILPGVPSANGWSFLRSHVDALMVAPLVAAGYQAPPGIRWIRLHGGRAYFNLSALQWAMHDCLGTTPAEFNRMIGGHQPEIAVPPSTLAQRVRRTLRQWRLVAAAQAAMKAMPAIFAKIRQWCARAGEADLALLSPEELLAKLVELERVITAFLPPFQLINGAAGGAQQELFKALQPVFGERAVALANDMLAGASEATSAQQGERLVRLGNAALQEEQARAYFAAEPWEPAAWAERLAGTAFLEAFTAYLQDYGHRGVYEVEIMNPRWREDPTYLLEVVRAQVLSGRQISLPDQARRREQATREVLARLGLGPRRFQVLYLASLAGKAANLREMSKSELVRLLGVSRLLVLEAGRRLTEAELLLQPADVFQLSWLDLEAYLSGRTDGRGFQALVADRAARRAEHLAEVSPDVLLGDDPLPSNAPATLPVASTVAKPAGAGGAGPALSGMGVASGRVTGRARVIRHPEEGTRLQPGEILVAPSTDPAWTPLFLRAGGIAMEVGGYLSHGAIVAREYGLPAVVNIPGLLTAVQDGDTIIVDGDAGKVYLRR